MPSCSSTCGFATRLWYQTRVLRRPALRRDQRVAAVVLHPHQRACSAACPDFAPRIVTRTIGRSRIVDAVRRARLEDLLGLVAHPALGAELVLAVKSHAAHSNIAGRSPLARLPSASDVGRRAGGPHGRAHGRHDPAAGHDDRGHRLRRRRRCGRRPADLRGVRGARLRGGHGGDRAELGRRHRRAHRCRRRSSPRRSRPWPPTSGSTRSRPGCWRRTEIIRGDRARRATGPGSAATAPTPLVVDPVAASMHGDPLLADNALDAYRTVLFPRATVVTPNLDEVRLLVGIDVHDRAAQYEAATVLHALGPRHVLVKGGHLRGGHRRSASTCSTTAARSPSCPGPGSPPATPTAAATPWPSAIASGLARGLAGGRGDRAWRSASSSRPSGTPTRWAPDTDRCRPCGRSVPGGATSVESVHCPVVDLWLTSRTSVVRRHVRYIDGRRAIISDDYVDLRLVEGTEFAAPDNTTREAHPWPRPGRSGQNL